jgi:hypothetical protein
MLERSITIVLLLAGGWCISQCSVDSTAPSLFTIVPNGYSGLHFENTVKQTREDNHLINVEFVSGGGVAVGDIDNDGLQDIFFAGNQVPDKLYRNIGNLQFEDITSKSGIGLDSRWSTAVTFVDIDADGDQDIYVCRFIYLENEHSANQLYVNNGDLTFTEEALDFGIADTGFSTSAAFCDFDKDGLIDLYVVNQPPSIPGRRGKISRAALPGIQFSDRMYKNVGRNRFTDVTEHSGVRNFGFGLSALVGDFNQDSWQDIYVSNDFDVADHLYINQQNGTFVDMVKFATNHITNFSMGSDAADFDNDGYLDFMVVDMVHEDKSLRKSHMSNIDTEEFLKSIGRGVHLQYMTNTLQRNNGNGTFSDLARLAGVDKSGWSWGPLFADFNNDGYKDILITNGVFRNNLHSDLASLYQQKVDSLQAVARLNNQNPNKLIDVFSFVDLAAKDAMPNYIYRNNGDYSFTNMVEEWGFSKPTTSNGAAYADFDLDGDLDIVVNNVNAKPDLYKNRSSDSRSANFVRIRLKASDGTSIYGTKIMLYKNDQLWQVQHIINSRGFRSKSEDIAHFGIGSEKEVSKAIIVWQNDLVSVIESLTANQLYLAEQSAASKLVNTAEATGQQRLFEEVVNLVGLEQLFHLENDYNDFSREILLPYRTSINGPVLAVGDVNQDGLDDFYFGGSAERPGSVYIQKREGRFNAARSDIWVADKSFEDTDAAFSDIDVDGDLDLIVASGGNEFDQDDEILQDRIYLNDGFGGFVRDTSRIPEYLVNSSCIAVGDFDNDNDPDLFIGSWSQKGEYPFPTNSYLLENQGGFYVDVTEEKAPGMVNLGLVRAAEWTDYNNDKQHDLVVVGDWMPITFFTHLEGDKFEMEILSGLENTEGWYGEVKVADIDNDGDDDLIAGNLGLNYSYSATTDSPLELFGGDFDLNGSNDLLICYWEGDELFPWTSRDRAIQQIPSIAKLYPSAHAYSEATIHEIYGESLSNALHLQAKVFASLYIENIGEGNFRCSRLPSLAQASAINSVIIEDFDLDGNKDLLIAGNLFETEIEMPRHDAGTGLYLKGNGKGEFDVLSVVRSGFFAPNNVKQMHVINIEGKQNILVGNNNARLQTILHNRPGTDP